MAPLKILSLDGGTRPLVTCFLLQRLLAEQPALLEDVDVFAGTSSGAITSSIIAVSGTVREGVERAIAFWQLWHPFEGAGPLSPRTLAAVSGMSAFLTHETLYRHLRDLLGEVRLRDVRRRLLMPAVAIDNAVGLKEYRHWSIEIHHNLVPQDLPASPLLADLALHSSSIPVLHPVFQGRVDGGLYANNPSMCALTMAMDFLMADIASTMILSVGQGQASSYMALPGGDIGYGGWLLSMERPLALIKLVMEANLQATTYQASRILEDRFVRLDPFLATDLEPEASVPPELFNQRQQDKACAADIGPTLAQLEDIGWIAPAQTAEAAAPDAPTG
ncbi:patatin-like phospholipase family protein [Xanthobacter autotrophicus]|uniref:patatin-like phospholipase family protein n=1 Tax=Xanthobacter TaxID=279 RepID=UPI0024ABEC68|nr:patatin-like phospholipase family protein [Xanthobacter autotrophicus]MDI4664957.1 patatin-like phospholipase family protein [Xanthobacter autotrophicus]